MTFNEYQQEQQRTYHAGRLQGHVLGLCGEAGEVAESVKKSVYHGVDYTIDQMEKELGDVLWYLTAVANDHGLTLNDIAEKNISKLRARYPEGFVKGGGIR